MSSPQGIKSFFDRTGIRVNHIGMSGNVETFAKLKLSGTASIRPVRGRRAVAPALLAGGNDRASRPGRHPQRRQEHLSGIQEDPRAEVAGGKLLIAPWGWIPTVLVYNKSKVPNAPTTWETLLDPKYKGRISFSDQHEYMWPVASLLLGYENPFSMNKQQLAKATDILIRIKRNAPSVCKGWNEQLRLFVEETVWIGMSSPGPRDDHPVHRWSPDGLDRPKEGYYGWIDGDMLVKGSPNREAALDWINHIHSPDYVATNFKRLQRGAPMAPGWNCATQHGLGDMVRRI